MNLRPVRGSLHPLLYIEVCYRVYRWYKFLRSDSYEVCVAANGLCYMLYKVGIA